MKKINKRKIKKKEVKYGSGKVFHETKVLSRNIITDWVQGIRNVLGLELTAYSNTINGAVTYLEKKYLTKKVEWFRIDVEEFSKGGILVTIYGVYK